MNENLQEILSSLISLNKAVNNKVLSESNLCNLKSLLKKMNANEDTLKKLLNKLSSINLNFNDDEVISLLIAIHQNLSQLITYINVIHNATGKMVSNYRDEWCKTNKHNL